MANPSRRHRVPVFESTKPSLDDPWCRIGVVPSRPRNPPTLVAKTNPRRLPLVVLGIAAVVLALSFLGFYTSDGATKAREREARLELARKDNVSPVGTAAIPNVEIYSARRMPASEWIEPPVSFREWKRVRELKAHEAA